MLPRVSALLLNDPTVASIVSKRIYRFGEAPQRVQAPYVTWFLVSGIPENNLSDLPPIDRYEVQIDCWSDNTGAGDPDVEVLAMAVRDALEPLHDMSAISATDRDEQTKRYRVSMQFTWWEHRQSAVSSS